MKSHRDTAKLRAAVQRACRFTAPWRGEVFRAASVEYANKDDLLTGQGAKRCGGRWNPPGLFAPVYASLTPETALAEYLAQHRYFGWPDSSAMPYVMVGIEVDLTKVLDFTAGEVRRVLRVSETRMLDDSWRRDGAAESLSQALGRLSFEAGLHAIIVPSQAARGSSNVVVFRDNVSDVEHSLRIVNREKLPPPPGAGKTP